MKLITMSIISILAALAGCKSIPAVSAENVTYKSAHPFGGTVIQIEGARVTKDRVELDKYERHSAWGWGGVTVVTQDIAVTNYARERKPEEKTEIKTP